MNARAQGKREKETKFSFSLLNLSSFLCIVRRFLSESYTDMSLLLAYGRVDVSLWHAVLFGFLRAGRWGAQQLISYFA